MNPEPELPPPLKPAPHQRGFRARVHARRAPGESAFSQRALAASAVLHVALLGSVGFTSVVAGPGESGRRSQSIAFAPPGALEAERDRRSRSDPEQVPEHSPEQAELMRELWKPDLREAPEEPEQLAAPEFRTPSPARDEWPELSALLEESVPPREEQPPVEELLRETPPPAPEPEASAPAVAPLLLSAPPPPYPALARRMSWEGTVHCLIELAEDGSVAAVTVARTSGHATLDEAARRAILAWRFESGTGERRLTHKVTFRLSRSTGS